MLGCSSALRVCIQGALSPVTASIAVTIAAFSSVSARECSHDGEMIGSQQARSSTVAAFMNVRILAG
jgi:hypothetical protein